MGLDDESTEHEIKPSTVVKQGENKVSNSTNAKTRSKNSEKIDLRGMVEKIATDALANVIAYKIGLKFEPLLRSREMNKAKRKSDTETDKDSSIDMLPTKSSKSNTVAESASYNDQDVANEPEIGEINSVGGLVETVGNEMSVKCEEDIASNETLLSGNVCECNDSITEQIHSETREFSGDSSENTFKRNESDKNDLPDKLMIVEGEAKIINFSKGVFYNPVQEFNRDLSVAAISVFSEERWNKVQCESNIFQESSVDKNSTSNSRVPGQKYDDGITILEALSASGLRSIRYAKEVPGVKEIIANDISSAAVESIDKNVLYNNVKHMITTSNGDASYVMYTHVHEAKRFDVIDLDPYGCPSQFLDASIRSLKDGGLLLVTCTDMAVLAGNSPDTCFAKYGSISLRNSACHEMAIRIVLHCLQSHAGRYGRYIVPLLSISADFYLRVFVKVYTSKKICAETTRKLSWIYQCTGCQAFTLSVIGRSVVAGTEGGKKKYRTNGPNLEPNCVHCQHYHNRGGPIWTAPIHDLEFVEKMLTFIRSRNFNTMKRMEGMLGLISEELQDIPLFYTVESLCSKVHCDAIPQVVFHSALLNAGYKVSLSHCAPNSLKTNAPMHVIWDILRCWVQERPVSKKRLVEGSVAYSLLQKSPTTIADFSIHPNAISRSKINKLLRYQQNPQPYWGPGCRDRTNYPSEDIKSRRQRNQNKRKRSAKESTTGVSESFIIKTETSDDEDNND